MLRNLTFTYYEKLYLQYNPLLFHFLQSPPKNQFRTIHNYLKIIIKIQISLFISQILRNFSRFIVAIILQILVAKIFLPFFFTIFHPSGTILLDKHWLPRFWHFLVCFILVWSIYSKLLVLSQYFLLPIANWHAWFPNEEDFQFSVQTPFTFLIFARFVSSSGLH